MLYGKLTQPQVSRYLSWLSRNEHFGAHSQIYDDESCKLLDELFALMDQISPVSGNGLRTLWIRAERGPIEDFGDGEELINEGEYESRDQFERDWKSWYPDEIKWYELSTIWDKETGFRGIMLHHKYVIVQDPSRKPSGFPNEITEFVQWLVDSVKGCTEMLRAGTYNGFVRDNLPPEQRTGTIRRKDFWDVWPACREDFFKNITPEDIAEFIEKASHQSKEKEEFVSNLTSMTGNDFFRFCALGYAENHYEGCDLSPMEQYYLHADGRDNGLKEIDLDSPEAFKEWLHDYTRHGGHPWEVCRGGNSTNVSLHVVERDGLYYLYLAGDAWTRTIETLKFYLALTRTNLPVYLLEAETLVQRMQETELIGIVPDGVLPAYCESYFPNEHIIDFMNLPYEDTEKFLPFCHWQDEPQIHLLTEEEGV